MKKNAQLFKALADETRLRIMNLLLAGEELCVCDIMAVLGLPQSTVSRHLGVLRNADLVADRCQGIWMYYRLVGEETDLLDVVAQMCNESIKAVDERQKLALYLLGKSSTTCA